MSLRGISSKVATLRRRRATYLLRTCSGAVDGHTTAAEEEPEGSGPAAFGRGEGSAEEPTGGAALALERGPTKLSVAWRTWRLLGGGARAAQVRTQGRGIVEGRGQTLKGGGCVGGSDPLCSDPTRAPVWRGQRLRQSGVRRVPSAGRLILLRRSCALNKVAGHSDLGEAGPADAARPEARSAWRCTCPSSASRGRSVGRLCRSGSCEAPTLPSMP